MAYGATHGRIGMQMRKTRQIYDFGDFVDPIKQAKCEPVEMGFIDFIGGQPECIELEAARRQAALHERDLFS